MRFATLSFVGILATGVVVTGCGLFSAGRVSVDADSNGKSVALDVGQSLRIELKSNPSTGYRWQSVEQPDPAVLVSASEEYKPTVGLPMPGRGGSTVWLFSGKGSGATKIHLAHVPPGRTVADAADHFRLDVVVR